MILVFLFFDGDKPQVLWALHGAGPDRDTQDSSCCSPWSCSHPNSLISLLSPQCSPQNRDGISLLLPQTHMILAIWFWLALPSKRGTRPDLESLHNHLIAYRKGEKKKKFWGRKVLFAMFRRWGPTVTSNGLKRTGCFVMSTWTHRFKTELQTVVA